MTKLGVAYSPNYHTALVSKIHFYYIKVLKLRILYLLKFLGLLVKILSIILILNETLKNHNIFLIALEPVGTVN